LGASGAIAGVLGGFQVIFPRDRILVYIFPFWHVRITALLLTAFWFIMQLENGIGSITSTAQGGVAYFAHIGGFIAGLVLIKIFGLGARPAGEQDYQELGG
jgi:membrane associated rhomboid family serine protease